jgi:putative flippase GtrA
MVDVKSRARSGGETPSGWRALISALTGQRIVYLLAGAVTAVVYYLLMGLALWLAESAVPYLALVVVSHFCTVVIVYPGYRLLVFRISEHSWISGYLRFYVVGLGFLGTSLGGLPILVEVFGMPLMPAQALVIMVSTPLNYLVHRTWTFRAGRSV